MSIEKEVRSKAKKIKDGETVNKVLETEKGVTLSSISPSVVTDVDKAVEAFNIDTSIFSVQTAEFRSYQQGMKVEGKAATQDLHGYTIKLERKNPRYITAAIDHLLKNWKPAKVSKPKYGTIAAQDSHLLELSLYDAHFGKACVDDSSLSDLSRRVLSASKELLEKASIYPIDKIVIPLGHDFFHVDNFVGTTTKGTRVDSTPEHFSEVFTEGWRTVEEIIRSAVLLAPVEVIWVPGNHDKTTSFYLVELLKARFELSEAPVTFDKGLLPRKYRAYGKSLFGYTHGEEIKHDKLPLLMATECDDWKAGQQQSRFWRVGHFHKNKETSYNVGDTFNGVRVQVLPSLSSTDFWHYSNGYTGSPPCAEAWLWSKEGYEAHFSQRLK